MPHRRIRASNPRTTLRHHVEEARSITGYRLTVANVSRISDTQAQRILDYCHDGRCQQSYQSLLATFVFVLSMHVGIDNTMRILVPRNHYCRTVLPSLVCHLADYPPQDIHALMARLHIHQFLREDCDPHITVAESALPTTILPLMADTRSLYTVLLRDAVLSMVTRSAAVRHQLYQLTKQGIDALVTRGSQSTTYPASESECSAYITIGSCYRRRESSVNVHDGIDSEDCWNWARTQDNSIVMYDLGSALMPAEYDSDRVRRVPHEITASSLRGLAQGAPCWSLAYVEYALSHWSLDEALDRIVRAVNLRTSLSCHQFLTLCHDYESIQHIPDSWVLDILGVEQAPTASDTLGASVYPGDIVATYGEETVMPCIVTGIDHQTGESYLDMTMLRDDAVDMEQRRAETVLKLTQNLV